MLRLLPALLLSSVALAQSYFSAALEGAQEVPPVVTAGRGWGIVRVDATNNVSIFLFHEGLSGAPTAAHLHTGAVGVSGGVILPVAPAGPNAFSGSGVLTAGQVAGIFGGNTYLNVHTGANPSGEIRGQVVQSASSRYKGVLTGAQEVPPTPVAGTGTAVAYLHEPENRVVYLVNSTGLVNVTAAHFHQGAVGVSGGIVVPLNGSNGTYGGVSDRLPASVLAAWKANGCYANIHTAAFPAGAIRAQMLQDVGDHFVASIDGGQEVPPVPSSGTGGASLILDVNGTLTLQGAFAGLTSVTAAHVHIGPPGISGGIVFPLVITGSALSGTFTPSAGDLTNLRAGNWYVNIHTATFPGGEIRGQLGPAKLPTTFGEGCPGSSGVRPQIGATAFPSVGSSMSIDLYGAFPTSFALFAFGASRDTAGGVIPLPIALGTIGIGSPNCYLFVDPSSLLAFPINGLGFSNVVINVPFSTALRGQSFYSQWFAIDLTGFVASSALSMTVQ